MTTPGVLRIAFGVAVTVAGYVDSAQATDVAPVNVAMQAAARPSETANWRRALAPLAHVRFCIQHQDQCKRDAPAAAPVLSEEKRRDLARVDAEVNRSIRATLSAEGASGDLWTIAPRSGDCDDYAVTKRARLIAQGWPASALLLTQVEARGQPHLILTVRGADDDLVLDNLAAAPRSAGAARYRVVKMQSAADPEMWVAPVGPLSGARMALAD